MNADEAPSCFEIAGNPSAVEGADIETFGGDLTSLLFNSICLPAHYVGDQLLFVILSQ